VKDLLPIGQFAALSRLTQKALRLYDERGLLRPAHVDPATGYRRYSVAQLVEAERIRLLRALEVPLDEIAAILRARGEAARALLRRHRERLAARVAEVDGMIATLDGLGEDALAAYPARERLVAPQQLLAVRWQGPLAALGAAAGAAFGELAAHRQRAGAELAGPPLGVYHLDEGFREDAVDVEWCLPVDRPLSGAGRVTGRALPGGDALCTLHAGPFEAIGPAYAAVLEAARARGLDPSGPAREVYLVGPREVADPQAFRTEVILPVAR
jgi:DNA-binding transcriptional MerR regulator